MKELHTIPSRGDVQGDSFALLTAASMHNNHLIIPLLRVIRWEIPL